MTERHGRIAIIDISSNEIRMYVAEKPGETIRFIETLKYPLSLAKDTFGAGTVSFEKVSQLCGILKNFITVAGEYEVGLIKTVATTAIREAGNRDYILDQIRIKNGLNVKIIDESAEKLYIFKLLHHMLKTQLSGSTALMAHMGSGSVGIAYAAGENTALLQSIKAGALRVSELFENTHNNSLEFYLMIEEYLRTYTQELKSYLPADIESIVLSGNEAALIALLIGKAKDDMLHRVSRADFLTLFEEIKFKGAQAIAARYHVPYEKCETLLPAMCLYGILLEFVRSDEIIIPGASLGEAMVFEYFEAVEFRRINKEFNKNILDQAKTIAAKYQIPESHYTLVADCCNQVFDKMKKVHGMTRRDKLLLELAAILHDCGKFVNVEGHHIHAYHLIQGSEISGLTTEEIHIVATIALYHSRIVPHSLDDRYRQLRPSKRVLVSKLAAILRIADALDRSRKQKISSIDVRLKDNQLIIKADAGDSNIDLEKWAFKEKGLFFEAVFGIEPVFKIGKAV